MRYKRDWIGTVKSVPAEPDLVLSRHLRWQRPSNTEYSTLNGDEPDSITCASAWQGLIPMSSISHEAHIYKDAISGMWIQAVAWRHTPGEQAQAWCHEQLAQGASAIWYNHGARPHRPCKTMAERELVKINSTEITYVDLITEQGLLTFGGIDFTTLVDRARRRDVDCDYVPYESPSKTNKIKTQRVPTKRAPQPGWKPVRTPLGVFRSVSEASIAHNITPPGIGARIRTRSDYEFITMDEYLKVKNSVNNHNNGEDSVINAINVI